jgi:endonuclease-8
MVDVPEGDTIFRAAGRLRAALVGKALVRLEIRRDPHGRRGPQPGTLITAVEAKGKHLLIRFGDGHVLHTHMQMAGVWDLYRSSERWRRPGHSARVILRVDDGTTAVCFMAPLVELRDGETRGLPTRLSRMLAGIGPDLCGTRFDVEAVVARLASLEPGTELAAALLDQRVAAGIGNVFKSEICWEARVSPFAAIAALDEPTRRAIYDTARRQLAKNLNTPWRTTIGDGLAVYRRAGRRCLRCGERIRTGRDDAGRVTFWCPTCQPLPCQ